MFSTQKRVKQLQKRAICSLLMLTRELINRGQLYVIKSIEHSDLHWSRSSLLLALCCSLVDESKTSISIKKKKWKKTRRKNLSLSTSTSHSPRSPTRRFTWLDAALKTITIGLRMILFLYLDHLELLSNAPGSWRRSGPRSSCCNCLCPARPAASQGSSRTCHSRQSGSLRNHIRKFKTLMDSYKMIRFSIESSYSGWECENGWLGLSMTVTCANFVDQRLLASPVAKLLHVAKHVAM